MKSLVAAVLLSVLTACGSLSEGTVGPEDISHDVYFQLKEPSAENVAGLIAACEKLRGIPGVLHVTTGARAEDYKDAPNVTDWHVALHVVFEDRTAYAGYLPHPIHQELIDAWAAHFESVRVFDYDITSAE